jgi:hypothetical protein
VITHQQQEQKVVILKKGLVILNWKQISNKNLLQQSILQSINSSTTIAQHSEEYKLVNNMSVHQHSILKTKTYQQQELTSAQHSEEETHHYQQQTAVDDT